METNFRNIESAKSLFMEMEKEEEKYKKLRQLAFADYVETVKKEIRFDQFTFLLSQAEKWWDMKGTKYDKRKKYNEKEAYDMLIEKIKDDLIPADFEVTSLADWGSLAMRFKLNTMPDREFELHIPIARYITPENFYENCSGQIRLNVCFNDGCCWNFLVSSYKPSEIKQFVIDYTKPQEIWQ